MEEVPRIQPEGRGDHVWFEVEKLGITTIQAASDIGRAVGVAPGSIGYAGLKDARAVARQWMSLEGVDPERLVAVESPRLHVIQAVRHPRKLRRGWHSGNRFRIRLREIEVEGEDLPATAVGAILERLQRRGVPNYYGHQRFGTRGDTWQVGRALAREEWGEAVALIAGRPLRVSDPRVDPAAGIRADRDRTLRARELFEEGRFAEAAGAWPRGFGQCARLAEAMDRTGGDAGRAVHVLGKRMLRLYASAYQSWLFNRVLAERIDTLDTLLPGDLAWKHDSEALFMVENAAAEQPRADHFDISPTGPLVGRRMREPEGDVALLEARVLEGAGFRREVLESRAMRPLTGRRRPLRFRLSDVDVVEGRDDGGEYLELRFALPPGCYATTVLAELGQGGIREGSTAERRTRPRPESG